MNMKTVKMVLSTMLMLNCMCPAFGFSVPDTGQTRCYNNTLEVPCPQPEAPFYGQDGNYLINPMSYTKLDESGNVLPQSAPSWAMVLDNITGLMWENKTDDGSIHNKDNTYTWYDPTSSSPGTPGDGTDTKDFIQQFPISR